MTMWDRKPDPTPQEIAERSAEVQASWSKARSYAEGLSPQSGGRPRSIRSIHHVTRAMHLQRRLSTNAST